MPQYLTGDKEGIRAFIDKFDVHLTSTYSEGRHLLISFVQVFLFDCDGVLWSGDTVFDGTAETLDLLRSRSKQIVFVTNNSTKSRTEYQKKLTGMGIPAQVEEVFGSSYSAAIYISRILKPPAGKRKVFILGESGIEAELDDENIPHIGGSDGAYRRDMTAADYGRMAAGDPSLLDPEVGVVLAGLDHHFNYLKLALAYHYITGPNRAAFLATNIDSTFPSAGALFPGAGSISAPLVSMLGGREPLALGKPSQAMMDAIEGRFHLDRNRTCMVGDRINTDILFGIQGNLGGTLAVLTGVATREEVVHGHISPTAYVDRLSDLLEVEVA